MRKTKTEKREVLSAVPMPVADVKRSPESVYWLQLLGGIILGFVGMKVIGGFRPNWVLGGPLELLSAFLIICSFPKKFEIQTTAEEKKEDGLEGVTKPLWNAFIWLGIVILMVISQIKFRMDSLTTGWILALVSLFLIVLFRGGRALISSKSAEFHFDETLWFWIVMIGAAVLRFSLLGNNFTGLQGDEANNLTDEVGVLEGNLTSPFVTGWGGTPTFPDFIVAIFFKIFGVNLWVARLVSVLASLISLWFFHRWCRFWMGNLASLIAVFLLAVSWWFLYFSFSPFHNSLLLMWQIMAFYFLEKGLKEGKRMDFWWAGFCVAASLMNYVAGRSVPIAMFATVLGYMFFRKDRFLKTFWKPLILTALGFFWFAGPYLYYAVQYPNEIWGRVKPGWISYSAQQTGNYFFLLKSYFWTVSSLLAPAPGMDLRFAVSGLPLVDPFVAGLMLIGLALCLFNLSQPISWLLLPGFFLGLSANALARIDLIGNVTYVHSVRYSIIIPFVFFSCGWGFEWLLRSYQSFRGPKWGWIGWMTAAIVIGGLTLNEPLFVPRFGHDSGNWGEIGSGQIAEANLINANASKKQFLVEDVSLGPAIYFLTHGKAQVAGLSIDRDIPIHFKSTKDVMLIFAPWRISPEQTKKLKNTYPNAVWTEYKTPFGDPYIVTFDIPLAEVQERQKDLVVTMPLP